MCRSCWATDAYLSALVTDGTGIKAVCHLGRTCLDARLYVHVHIQEEFVFCPLDCRPRPRFSRSPVHEFEIQRGSAPRRLHRIAQAWFQVHYRSLGREVEIFGQAIVGPVDARQRGAATKHEFAEWFGHGNQQMTKDIIVLHMGRIETQFARAGPDLSGIDHVVPLSRSSSVLALMTSSQRLLRGPARSSRVVSNGTYRFTRPAIRSNSQSRRGSP